MAYFRNKERGNVIEAQEFDGGYESWRAIAAAGVACAWVPGTGAEDDPPFMFLYGEGEPRAYVGDFIVRHPGGAKAGVLKGDELRARYAPA